MSNNLISASFATRQTYASLLLQLSNLKVSYAKELKKAQYLTVR
jgi:hypothetical protein